MEPLTEPFSSTVDKRVRYPALQLGAGGHLLVGSIARISRAVCVGSRSPVRRASTPRTRTPARQGAPRARYLAPT